MKRPSIKSPCIADRYHRPEERIAEVAWPGVEGGAGYDAGCLVSVNRSSIGYPMLDVYRCEPNVRVRVDWGNLTIGRLTPEMLKAALASLGERDTKANRERIRSAIVAALSQPRGGAL